MFVKSESDWYNLD